MDNSCQIYKVQIIKNLSESEFHKVYKVSTYTATQQGSLGRQTSILYSFLLPVFVKFDMFTINKIQTIGF